MIVLFIKLFFGWVGEVDMAYRILWKAQSLKAFSGLLKRSSQTLGLKYSI